MSTIIVCADGSELALAAAKAGLEVLARPDRLVVVTVIKPPDEALLSGASGFAGGVVSAEEFQELNDITAENGDEIVRSVIEALGVDGVESLVLVGDPGIALCEAAEELSASVIVLGSRGRSGIKRAVLGSVSDHVSRHAPCPVLIVGDHH